MEKGYPKKGSVLISLDGVSMSAKILRWLLLSNQYETFGYLDAFDWRFNGRENPYLFRDTLVRLLDSTKMEFKELTKTC